MSRTLTVQVGSHANWVGAHYWSSLERKSQWSPTESGLDYNETAHGRFEPRLFCVDTTDSIGPMSVELPEEEPSTQEGFEVVKVERAPTDRSSTQIDYWSDFWDLPNLPSHRFILPTSDTPTETRNRFWFECESIASVECLDETELRKLVEQTDSSMDVIRTLSSLHDGVSAFSKSTADYLMTAYPKSSLLSLTSQLPLLGHFQHDHAVPCVVNWISQLASYQDFDRALIVTPNHREYSKLERSGEEGFWLNSVSQSRREISDFRIESPILSIDGKQIFTAPILNENIGSWTPQAKTEFYINNANPLSGTVNAKSSVLAGTVSENSLLPYFENSVGVLKKFLREGKAVWQPFALEQADWEEMGDFLKLRIADIRGNLDE
jgi:hypothetical protein